MSIDKEIRKEEAENELGDTEASVKKLMISYLEGEDQSAYRNIVIFDTNKEDTAMEGQVEVLYVGKNKIV